MMALIMTMKNKPQAVMMSFQKEYAERYDWLVTLFKDWAFTFMSSFLYYQNFDMLDDMQNSFTVREWRHLAVLRQPIT